MSYLKKILFGYHISYLWRKENFRSVERFNDYTYKLSFSWFGILSASHAFLPISILLCVGTALNSHGIVLLSLILSMGCATIVSKKLKSKFSIDWFMMEIVMPVNEMSAEQRKKRLMSVNLLFLLNFGLMLLEIITFMVYLSESKVLMLETFLLLVRALG